MSLDVPHLLGAIIEIVWLNLILSGDNAVALAWSTRALPQEQRRLAVNLGGLGFMILRAMLAFALFVCLKLAGFGLFCGLLLLWAAVAVSLRVEAPPADPPPMLGWAGSWRGRPNRLESSRPITLTAW